MAENIIIIVVVAVAACYLGRLALGLYRAAGTNHAGCTHCGCESLNKNSSE